MNHEEILQKYSADKIFLLCLFAASLLTAYWMVEARSAIILTEPIELKHIGLSAPIPHKNGWESNKKWTHKDNTITLSSYFQPQAQFFPDVVQFIYHLASDANSRESEIDQMITNSGMEMVEEGKKQAEGISFEWKCFKYPDDLNDISNKILAYADLGQGRWLELIISVSDINYVKTQKLLKKIIGQVSYRKNNLLTKGIEIIDLVKNKPLLNSIHSPQKPELFVIKSVRNKPIGYILNMTTISGNTDDPEIRFTRSAYNNKTYIKREKTNGEKVTIPANLDQATYFITQNSYKSFTWESEVAHTAKSIPGLVDRYYFKVNMVDTNNIAVLRQSNQQDLNVDEKYNKISRATLPSIFRDAIFKKLLMSQQNNIIVDFIKEGGKVIPALISIMDNDPKLTPKASYTLKVEFIGLENIEIISLDNKMNMLRKSVTGDNNYIFEPASLNDLIRLFPERAGAIIEKVKFYEQNVI